METSERAATTVSPASRSPIPLLTTKVTIPGQRAGIVPRTRLTDRLEQDYRLALVVAPAGWGKSSVVREWCAQSAAAAPSVAWISLDAGDNDSTRFLLYLAAAFDRAQPGLGEATRSLLQSPQPLPAETVLTVLLNEISALARSLILVLDDYHLIEAQGDDAALAPLFEEIEASCSPTDFPYLPSFITALRVKIQPERKEIVEPWLEEQEARIQSGLLATFPVSMYYGIVTQTWAELRLAQGQAALVKAPLEHVLEKVIVEGHCGAAVEVRVLLAVAYQQEGRMDRAVAVLEPALALAAQEGYVRVFLDAGKLLVPVLRQAAAQSIEPEYVGKLLAAFREEGLLQEKQREERVSALAEPLSEREVEVLRLVAAGLSNPEIAEHLFLSVGTVKRHVYNIYGKLEVTGRVEAVTRARDLKLL